MIRAALAVVALAALSGCAGQAEYNITPYAAPGGGPRVYYGITVKSSRDVAAVHVTGTRNADGSITFNLTETGISASAPIQAQNGAVSAVAGAVSNTAAAAVKFIP